MPVVALFVVVWIRSALLPASGLLTPDGSQFTNIFLMSKLEN